MTKESNQNLSERIKKAKECYKKMCEVQCDFVGCDVCKNKYVCGVQQQECMKEDIDD